jgi:hypothetical protein
VKRFSKVLLAALPVLVFFTGCSVAPTRMSLQDQQPVRAAAHEFTSALKAADGKLLQQMTTVDSDPETRKLAQAVVADSVSARQIQLQLIHRFDRCEDRPSVIGSDSWIDQIEQTAARGDILQAGERARIGEAGSDGTLFLRRINGQWKVELVPSLVAESGGRTRMDDPVVDYRFNVTRAVNEHFLARLNANEFASLHDYLQAKNQFWFQYMTLAAHGDDPHDKLLPSLPPMPSEPLMLAIER